MLKPFTRATTSYQLSAAFLCLLCLLSNFLTVSEAQEDYERAELYSFRIISKVNGDLEVTTDGVKTLIPPSDDAYEFEFYGSNFPTNQTVGSLSVGINIDAKSKNDGCTELSYSTPVPLTLTNSSSRALGSFNIPEHFLGKTLYFCLFIGKTDLGKHQGSDDLLSITIKYQGEHILPIPAMIPIIGLLLCLSALFSGLNLGLMALDIQEINLIKKCGSDQDKVLAAAIEPIRKKGNILLVTLLLGNTIVNSTMTIFLDDLIGSGLSAVLLSTCFILVFGEIIPQSVCSRHGLKVGYYTRFLVLFFMYLLYPIVYSIGKLLDVVLGREVIQSVSRNKLREIVKMVKLKEKGEKEDNDIFNLQEVEIMGRALEITQKTVSDIMKPRTQIFMLDIDELIDYDLIFDITSRGFTRIPIHSGGDRDNIVGILNVKDLLGIDPEDKMPLKSVIDYYRHKVIRVRGNMTLLDMLNHFKLEKVHLALVTDSFDPGDGGDPIYRIEGMITLEDLVEFILSTDFDDETDQNSEDPDAPKANKTALYLERNRAEVIPHQLCLAAVQYLTGNVAPFSSEIVESNVLFALLKQPGKYVIRKFDPTVPMSEDTDANRLYRVGQPIKYFVLILQGNAHVRMGREKLPFLAGPFHHFGTQSMVLISTSQPLEGIPTEQPLSEYTLTLMPNLQPLEFLLIDATDYKILVEASKNIRAWSQVNDKAKIGSHLQSLYERERGSTEPLAIPHIGMSQRSIVSEMNATLGLAKKNGNLESKTFHGSLNFETRLATSPPNSNHASQQGPLGRPRTRMNSGSKLRSMSPFLMSPKRMIDAANARVSDRTVSESDEKLESLSPTGICLENLGRKSTSSTDVKQPLLSKAETVDYTGAIDNRNNSVV